MVAYPWGMTLAQAACAAGSQLQLKPVGHAFEHVDAAMKHPCGDLGYGELLMVAGVCGCVLFCWLRIILPFPPNGNIFAVRSTSLLSGLRHTARNTHILQQDEQPHAP